MKPNVDYRQMRGYAIISKGDTPQLVNEETFLVPSQTDTNKKYKVILRRTWICECPDYQNRKTKCKHIYAVEFLLKMRDKLNSDGFDLEKELSKNVACAYCKSDSIKENGNRKTKSGVKQRYYCKSCKRTFIEDKEFEKLKANGKLVTLTMDLLYKGLSLRDISDTLHQFYGLKVSHETIRNWITKFTKSMNDYVNRLNPKLSNTWHTDEQMVKVKGKWLYNWNVLDADTRFLIANNITKGREVKDAQKVFKKTKEIASESPDNIVTDGLWSYERAIKKEFLPHRTNTEHIRLSTIREKPNNNLVERFHNTFREFDKVRRGFKTQQTAQLLSDGFRTYYNFIRPHSALDGITPSQMAGLELGLNGNKWLGLIRLANQNKDISEEKKFKLKFKSGKKFLYFLKVFDKNDSEMNCKELGFKEKFFDVETANKFIEFYKLFHPNFKFEVSETKDSERV